MLGPVVFYDVSEVTAHELSALVYSLPKFHQYGDVLSVWPNGLTANGPAEHDAIVPRIYRDRCRNRCTGLFLSRSCPDVQNDRPETPTYVTYGSLFVSVPDWTPGHFESLPFVESCRPGFPCPPGYLEWHRKWISIDQLFVYWVSQIRLGVQSAKTLAWMRLGSHQGTGKAQLRMWPLVSKRVLPEAHQNFLGYLYGFALLTALQAELDRSWCDSVEICDFVDISAEVFFGHMTQYQINYVPIRNSTNVYTDHLYEIVPSDNFCLPGLHSHTLENSLTMDTDLFEVLNKPWSFYGLEGLQARNTVRSVPDRWAPSSLRQGTFGWSSMETPVQSNV